MVTSLFGDNVRSQAVGGIFRYILGLFVALFLVIGAPAWAARADFTGAWQLDDDASQSMDEIFGLQDLGWAKRKLAERLDNSMTITQDANGLVAAFDNLIGVAKQKLVFDGKPRAPVNPAGRPTTFSSKWGDDRRLVAAGPSSIEEGPAGTLTEKRSRSADGKTMTILVTITTADGRKTSAKRVFRRAG